MSGPGNREVRPMVIYDWKTMVEMIYGKFVLSLEWKGEEAIDGYSGDADENDDLAWPRKWDCEAEIERDKAESNALRKWNQQIKRKLVAGELW